MGSLGDGNWLGSRTISKANQHQRRSSSSPIFRSGPSQPIGAGAPRIRRALTLLTRFGSSPCSTAISIIDAESGRQCYLHTARSTAFPQPAPGTAPAAGPMLVPAETARFAGHNERRGASWQRSSRDHRYAAGHKLKRSKVRKPNMPKFSYAAPRPRSLYRRYSRRRSSIARSRGGHGGEYRNFTFAPKELTVKAGTVIVFRIATIFPTRSMAQMPSSIPRRSIRTRALLHLCESRNL